jgi:hypothetical protein
MDTQFSAIIEILQQLQVVMLVRIHRHGIHLPNDVIRPYTPNPGTRSRSIASGPGMAMPAAVQQHARRLSFIRYLQR